MAKEEFAPVMRPVIPLPIALYYSNGFLFELFQGGQPDRVHQITWEGLKPIEERTDEGSSCSKSQ